MKYHSLGMVALVVVFAVCSCATAPSGDTPPNVRCFYGPSHSFSSRPTALNGAMFVEVVEKDDYITCSAVFYHKFKFHRATAHTKSHAITKSATFQGTMEVGTEAIPLRLELKNGVLHGQIGEGLDKGILTLDELEER